MRIVDRVPRSSKRLAALLVGLAVAATALPPQLRAESGPRSPARLDAIYIADPAAPWFEQWAQTNLKVHDWLRRPDIRIKAGSDLVAAVAADPAAIGLLTHGELSRIQAAGSPPIKTASTGVSICAALSVSQARREENFGDFAMVSETIDVFATSDTLAIAEALVDAHRFRGRMTLKQAKADFAFAEIASEKAAIAVMPVLPQTRLHAPENAAGFRVIGMSEAATDALRSKGLYAGAYRISFFQQFPLIAGVRTACDEIVLISAADTSFSPDLVKAPPPPWTNPFTGSELEQRVRQALDDLRSLWAKSPGI
jgi:hypothetical protein